MYGRMDLIDLSFSGHVRIDLFFDLLIPHIGLLIPHIGLLIPHIGLLIFCLMFLKIVKLMLLDMCSVETHFGLIFCLSSQACCAYWLTCFRSCCSYGISRGVCISGMDWP
jgi:hypothetical protein